MMSAFDEMKGDFMKMIATLGIIILGYFAFTLYSISTWLLIFVLIVVIILGFVVLRMFR